MLRRYRSVFATAILLAATASAAQYAQVSTFAGGSASSTLSGPYGLALAPSGDLIVADSGHHQIKRISPAGVVSVLAGTGELGDRDGAANFAQFKNPVAVAVDPARDLIYVADTQSDSIRKIAGDGTVSTFAATGLADPMGLAVDANGNVYVADSGNNKIKKITPAGAVATIAGTGQAAYLDHANALSAKFNQPNGLAQPAR